jgi:hypothetical protein
MIEGLHSSVLDERPGVSDDSAGGAADVGVNFEDLLKGLGDDEGGVESAFDCKNNALAALDADGGGAQLDGERCTLIASMAYSTWKILPSGEKVLMPRS